MPASKKKAPAKTSPVARKPAKKAAKPAASTVKSAAARLKSLFSAKPKAAAKKPARPAAAVKKKPAAKPAKPVKAVKAPKAPAKAKPQAKKPVKAAPARKAAPTPAAKPAARKSATVPTAVVAKPVTKPAKGRHKPFTYRGELTEDLIRRMPERDYMNDAQLDFFRLRLLQMREEVLAREVDVKERLHQREIFADPADRATAEEEHWLDLRLRERESLLLRKIDEALRRIAEKEFGYCEKTGDPIGIPRLLARPTATVCVDIKGQDERVEAQFRDR